MSLNEQKNLPQLGDTVDDHIVVDEVAETLRHRLEYVLVLEEEDGDRVKVLRAIVRKAALKVRRKVRTHATNPNLREDRKIVFIAYVDDLTEEEKRAGQKSAAAAISRALDQRPREPRTEPDPSAIIQGQAANLGISPKYLVETYRHRWGGS